MLALKDFVVPSFDGHTPYVMEWVDHLASVVQRFEPLPFAYFLSAIRSHLTKDAAAWWDAQTMLPNDLQTLISRLVLRFAVGSDSPRALMTRLMSDNRPGPVTEVMKRIDSVKKQNESASDHHKDYPYIIRALSLMDCPVVVHRLHDLPLEDAHYSWDAFKKEAHHCYTLEVAHQARLCSPYIGRDNKLRFGDSVEFNLRSGQLSSSARTYCLICMSTQHHTDFCKLLEDIFVSGLLK